EIVQAEARTLRPESEVSAGSAASALPGKKRKARQMSPAPAETPKLDEDTQRPAPVQAEAVTPTEASFFDQPTPGSDAADHRSGFFETGDQMEAIALELPDPERHKPTKEEYQNLLQEFSVMFRLDRRSKRQKVGVAVVLVSLVLGVCAFGVILYLQGKQRQALMNDAKTILAVFTLSYQSSVTVNLSEEAEQESREFGAKVAGGAKAKTKTSSGLAEQLRSKVRRERIASQRRAKRYSKKKKKYKNLGISATELAALQAQARGDTVLRDKFGRKVQKVGIDTRREPSRVVMRGLCRGGVASMKKCAKSVANEAPFKAKLFVSTDGAVSKVEARVNGRLHPALSKCIRVKMSNKRVGQLTRSASIVCAAK
ncbi:MAG TPA: hypothetical protein DCQ06_04935, partial [Myxococcales bacterium]|nr:hypothetical protein [Myxococcales bacterium]